MDLHLVYPPDRFLLIDPLRMERMAVRGDPWPERETDPFEWQIARGKRIRVWNQDPALVPWRGASIPARLGLGRHVKARLKLLAAGYDRAQAGLGSGEVWAGDLVTLINWADGGKGRAANVRWHLYAGEEGYAGVRRNPRGSTGREGDHVFDPASRRWWWYGDGRWYLWTGPDGWWRPFRNEAEAEARVEELPSELPVAVHVVWLDEDQQLLVMVVLTAAVILDDLAEALPDLDTTPRPGREKAAKVRAGRRFGRLVDVPAWT